MTTNAYSICHPLQVEWAALGNVLYEICEEREDQNSQWGEQNHPDVPEGFKFHEEYARKADEWKKLNPTREKYGILAWDGILLEEVYEALSESDPAKLRAELVQVAAVAVAWIEAIDRRESS